MTRQGPSSADNVISMGWLPLSWFSLLFLALVLGMVGTIAAGDPMEIVGAALRTSTPALTSIVLHELGLLIAVAGLVAIAARRTNPRVAFALVRVPLRACGTAVVAAMAVFVSWPLAERLLQTFVPIYWWPASRLVESRADLVWTLVVVVLVAPLVEEVMYRGYVLRTLLARFRPGVAVPLAAAIFSSIHVLFGPGMMALIFLWSFVPSWLTLRYRSILPGVVMHMCNNALAYVVVPQFGL